MSSTDEGKLVIILGASGMLGATLAKYFVENTKMTVMSYGRSEFEVIRGSDVIASLMKLSQSWPHGKVVTVLNAIGSIPQKVDPSNNAQSFILVNSVLPHLLYHFCCIYGARLIHISTDCVFDGFGSGGYGEDDAHTETTLYGVSKSCGEPCGASIVRTSIIGEDSKCNKGLLEWLRHERGNTVRGYQNHLWNGVTTLELSKVLAHIVLHDITWSGVRNVISPSPISKLDLLILINDIYQLQCKIEPFETAQPISKTLKLSNDSRIASITTPSLKAQLEELKSFWGS